jgi:RNA polymerase sigma-70 factor, ECF subfamily
MSVAMHTSYCGQMIYRGIDRVSKEKIVGRAWSVSPFWIEIAFITHHFVKITESELCMRFRPVNGQPPQRLDFSQYLNGLYGYAVVLSRNHTEAEDLVQETCLRALRNIGQLRSDSNVKSWLFTILRNIWLNEVRRWRAAPEMVEAGSDGDAATEPPDPAKSPHEVYVSSVEREQVREAIQRLPVEFREIIILREYEELSYQEIAVVLKCPAGTVMSRLARARSRLRELLAHGQIAPDLQGQAPDLQGQRQENPKTGGTAA